MSQTRFLLLGVALLGLSACQPTGTLPSTNYAQLPPVSFRASAVLVDDATTPGADDALAASVVEQLRTAIMGHYKASMAQSSGAPELRFTIQQASVVQTALPAPESQMERLMRSAPDTRYDGHVVVEATMGGRGGSGGQAYARAEATRQLELGNVTGEQRQAQVQGLVNQMVGDVITTLDAQLAANASGVMAAPAGQGGNDLVIAPEPSGRWDKVKDWQ